MVPRYSLSSWRAAFSAFGGIAYFLKAMSDYSLAFNDKYAGAVFSESVSQIISLQGPRGEWPWFINATRARCRLVPGLQRPSGLDVDVVPSSRARPWRARRA